MDNLREQLLDRLKEAYASIKDGNVDIGQILAESKNLPDSERKRFLIEAKKVAQNFVGGKLADIARKLIEDD